MVRSMGCLYVIMVLKFPTYFLLMIVFYFVELRKEECQTILDLLATYERGSGQKINREKTNIFFSSNTYL